MQDSSQLAAIHYAVKQTRNHRMSKFFNTMVIAGFLASSTAVWAGTETAATTEEATEAVAEMAPVMIDEALAKKGKKTFKKCKACHKVGDKAKNGVGPMLNGVYGAEMGSKPDYKYSKGMLALAADGGVWTEENLRTFLTSPKKFVNKTKMSFKGLKEKDLDGMVEYLKSVSQ